MNGNTFHFKRPVSRNDREGHTAHAALRSNIAPLARGMVVGSLGGLVATLVMDLVLAGIFSVMGIPADFTFSFIGDTAAGFFFIVGIPLAGGAFLGVLVQYLIGLALGGIFGIATFQVDALRVNMMQKGIFLGALCIEIAGQPIIATAPLIRVMTISETVQWFGWASFMHLIYGAVLGLVVSYGLRSAIAARQG